MPRYSQRDVFGDGQYVYDDRHDAGEFSTYSRSRGPSSGNTSYASSRSSRSSRHPTHDTSGYPFEGAYAGEQDLRRSMSRYELSELSAARPDLRARLGLDYQSPFEIARRARLSGQDGRVALRQAMHQFAEYEHRWEREREREIERERERERERRREAEDDVYLAYLEDVREQQQREQEQHRLTPAVTTIGTKRTLQERALQHHARQLESDAGKASSRRVASTSRDLLRHGPIRLFASSRDERGYPAALSQSVKLTYSAM
ncbi:hypothetical protein OPT61_g2326 [Boeremia exigua]|uniref:Uncharacterized protein n=1 Tax=Boeremia exigua TaxID=749465 RepID=A0ACC2IM84_9PLEO|nr:hypothetical protein OPT61_g2326 [Boeremia exigua]